MVWVLYVAPVRCQVYWRRGAFGTCIPNLEVETMNDELLRSSVEVLKSLRAELHGNVEDSVIGQLDKVIRDLEAAQQESSGRYSSMELLFLLGSILEKLPAIVGAIELLAHLVSNTPNH